MATLEIMQELRNWRAKEVPHHDVSCNCERCNLAKTMSLESLRGLIGNHCWIPASMVHAAGQ